ncbi:MAG: rhomboid family intramembrane serine protease [Desulfobacteraceae bacterium]|nr:rhomboid family intramembrane serine protease [Desulfobacteraceae bacterium]
MGSMRPLFAGLSETQARTYELVLKAMAIPHHVYRKRSGRVIEVSSGQRRAAVKAIRLYRIENPESITAQPENRLSIAKTYSAIYFVAALVTIHAAVYDGYERKVFFDTYSADAASILKGQVYRCVSALLFHIDWAHLLGNTAGLLIFGTAVASLCGWGIGWLMIVSAAAMANLITALWYGSNHSAVGASTALFAAVGICSVISLSLRINRKEDYKRAMLPLMGGMAFLAYMGSSPNSDLAGHLFGFISGLAAGAVYALFFKHPARWPWQSAAMLATFILIAGSWIWGVTAI